MKSLVLWILLLGVLIVYALKEQHTENELHQQDKSDERTKLHNRDTNNKMSQVELGLGETQNDPIPIDRPKRIWYRSNRRHRRYRGYRRHRRYRGYRRRRR